MHITCFHVLSKSVFSRFGATTFPLWMVYNLAPFLWDTSACCNLLMKLFVKGNCLLTRVRNWHHLARRPFNNFHGQWSINEQCPCARSFQVIPGPSAWHGHNPTASRQWNVAPEEAKSIKPRSSQWAASKGPMLPFTVLQMKDGIRWDKIG